MSKKTTVSGILLVLLVLATTPLLGTDNVSFLKWWLMTLVLGIGFYPAAAYQDVSAFKLYYSDMGIMSARIGMTLEALNNSETEHFRGIMAENYVSVALKTNGYDLYYWESDNTAEVDFLIQKNSHVIPVECKAGNHVKAKSMMVYMEKYDPVYAIRISTRNFGMVKGIKAVPLYSVFCI